MTIGLCITNGREAISVTDSQASGGGRKSDSVNKTGIFNEKNYQGVVFGSGRGDRIENVIRNLDSINGETLGDFAKNIQRYDLATVNQATQTWINEIKETQEIKLQLIQDPKRRTEVLERMIGAAMEKLDKYRERTETNFIVTGYEKEKGKISFFSTQEGVVYPVVRDSVEIGSGSDGANFYFGTKLPGIKTASLSLSDLAFFAMNAYSFSNINQGVGGTPTIVAIDEHGAKPLEHEQAVILANLSGAYLAEYDSQKLSQKRTRRHFRDVMNGKPKMEAICNATNLNQESLTEVDISYSKWQERANRKNF